jgi:hypothetical protein
MGKSQIIRLLVIEARAFLRLFRAFLLTIQVSYMAIYPVKLQVALFLATIDLSSKLKIASLIRERANGQLNADPILLPIPDGAPAEFPHILIRDEQTKWSFQLAPARLDLMVDYGKQKSLQPLTETLRRVESMAISIWEGCQRDFGAIGNRIGIVISTAVEMPDAPGEFRRRYLDEKFGSNSIESHFYTLTKLTSGAFVVNCWVKVVAMLANDGGPSRIVTEVDINTTPDKPTRVDTASISAFGDAVSSIATDAFTSYAQGLTYE